MKAIVYTSQTGHTQRYAQMLAERTGVPAYSLKEAGKSLRRGEERTDRQQRKRTGKMRLKTRCRLESGRIFH